MKKYKGLVVLILLIGSYTCFILSKKIYTTVHASLFSIESITYTFEHLYSSSLKQDLSSFLDTTIANKQNHILKGNQLYNLIREKFPAIEKVSWKKYGPHLHINLTCSQAWAIINKTHVALKNNYLLQCDLFDLYNLETLPFIQIKADCTTEPYINQQITECLTNLPIWIFEDFIIEYKKPSMIVLTPKKRIENLNKIITNETTMSGENIRKVMNHLAYIKKDCLNENQAMKNIELDIRFKNRIVVKKQRG